MNKLNIDGKVSLDLGPTIPFSLTPSCIVRERSFSFDPFPPAPDPFHCCHVAPIMSSFSHLNPCKISIFSGTPWQPWILFCSICNLQLQHLHCFETLRFAPTVSAYITCDCLSSRDSKGSLKILWQRVRGGEEGLFNNSYFFFPNMNFDSQTPGAQPISYWKPPSISTLLRTRSHPLPFHPRVLYPVADQESVFKNIIFNILHLSFTGSIAIDKPKTRDQTIQFF